MASHRGRGFSSAPPINWGRSSGTFGAVPRWLPVNRCARSRSPRPHDARGEVLAAVHDPGRSRRPVERLLERCIRTPDLVEAECGSRERRASARRANQRDPEVLRRANSAWHSDHSVRRSVAWFGARRRDGLPTSDRPRRVVRHGASGARRAGDRTRSGESGNPTGAVASDQPRDRRAMGPRRRDVRRRSGAHVAYGRGIRLGVRVGRHHRDAEALHRQRRRGRARQLSDRLQQAPARGDVLSALRGGDLAGACADR